MDLALITSAALLGLAGTPHCAAMCGAPCAAATAGQGRWAALGFQLARMMSYALAGGVAAASVSTLAQLSQVAPALRPLWTLLHAAAFALGLWLLINGRQPAWMGAWGRAPAVWGAQTVVLQGASGGAGRWPQQRHPSNWRALTAGALWAAWPCGLLQSALLVAALGSGAAAGAVVMGTFALASSAGLWLAPWVWRRWLSPAKAGQADRWIARLGGAMLAAGSGWALSHGLWQRVAVWCGLG